MSLVPRASRTPRPRADHQSPRADHQTLRAAKGNCKNSLANFETALREHDPSLSNNFTDICRQQLPDFRVIVHNVNQIADSAARRHPTLKYNRTAAMRFITFLERIYKFSSIGDVLVGGAQNMVVSGVWGAVRLAIEVSLPWLTFYEKVSDMLLRIGKALELNDEFVRCFPDSIPLQRYAWQYLTIVVDIATKVVNHAKQSYLSALWTDLDGEFQILEGQLGVYAEAIRGHSQVEAARENQSSLWQVTVATSWTRAALGSLSRNVVQRERRSAKTQILSNIPANQECVRWAWKRHFAKGSSSWLLDTYEFNQWKSSETSGTLWLEGSLGSGKSVTMASAIANLSDLPGDQSESFSTLSYYFCDDTQKRANSAITIVSSIIRQALESRAMDPFLDRHVAESDEATELTDTAPDDYVNLLLRIAPKTWSAYILIDGIDQCAAEDVEALTRELGRLASERRVLLFFSSRNHWSPYNNAKASLSEQTSFTTVTMGMADRTPEATQFIEIEMSKWPKDLITRDFRDAIRQKLLGGWDMMFLWLTLQLQMIRDELVAKCEVADILSRLPHQLSDVYDKSLMSIPARYELVTQNTLQIVAAADPPLTFQQLRVAINIRPNKLRWDPEDLTAVPSAFCWRYGGYLLDVNEDDDKVRFIHPSVRMHLFQRTKNPDVSALHFSFPDAREHFGLVCVTILSIPDLHQQALVRRKAVNTESTRLVDLVAKPVVRQGGFRQRVVSRMSSNDTTNLSHVLSDIYVRESSHNHVTASYAIAEFLEYAKAHWVGATRDIKGPELWKRFFDGKPLLRSLLPDLDGSGKAALIWAIEHAHRSLFSALCLRLAQQNQPDPVVDEDYSLNQGQSSQLRMLLFYRWADFEWFGFAVAGGWRFGDFFCWLHDEHPADFGQNWERIVHFTYHPSTRQDCFGQHYGHTLVACLAINFDSVSASSRTLVIDALRTAVGDVDGELAGMRSNRSESINFGENFASLTQLRIMLEAGLNPDTFTVNGQQGLECYISLNDYNKVGILCEFGVDVNVRGPGGNTGLMHAAGGDFIEICELLIRHGADIWARNDLNLTVLHFPIVRFYRGWDSEHRRRRRLTGFQLLVDVISEVAPSPSHRVSFLDEKSDDGTALYLALAQNDDLLEEATILLRAGARRVSGGSWRASYEVLGENQFGPDSENLQLLRQACLNGFDPNGLRLAMSELLDRGLIQEVT